MSPAHGPGRPSVAGLQSAHFPAADQDFCCLHSFPLELWGHTRTKQKKQPKLSPPLPLKTDVMPSGPVSEGDFTGFESLPNMVAVALMYNSNSMDCHLVQKAFYSDLLGSQNNLVWSFASSCDHSNNLYKGFFSLYPGRFWRSAYLRRLKLCLLELKGFFLFI